MSMASLPENPEPRQAYQELAQALRSYQMAGLLRLAAKGALYAAAAFLVAACVAVTLERTIGLPGWTQRGLIMATVLAPVLALGVLLRRCLGCWRASFWARELTESDADLGWTLRVGMGLWPLRARGNQIYSRSLVDAGLARAAAATIHMPASPGVRILPQRTWAFVGLLLGSLAAAACYPRASSQAALRVLYASGSTHLTLHPRVQWVARGSVASLRVMADPPTRTSPTAEVSTDSVRWTQSAPPRPSASVGLFALSVGPVDTSCLVRARWSNVVSPVARIIVRPKPAVIDLKLRVQYPTYTGVGTVVVPQGVREVRALKGSGLEVLATLSGGVSEALMLGSAGDTLRMELEGPSARGFVTVATDETLRISLRDSLGQRGEYPCCRLGPVDDAPPSVAIPEPGRDTQMDESMAVPLSVEVQDDFGFSRVSVQWSRTAERDEVVLLEAPQQAPALRLRHVWDLSALSLLPGDTLIYWAEVVDNDAAMGGKRAFSDTFRVHFPSLSEILTQTADEQREAAAELDEALRDQQDLLGETEEISTANELTWEKKRAAEQLMHAQEQLLERVSQTAEELQKKLSETGDDDLRLSRQIATEASRLHQLLSELDDPSLRAAMEELRKALAALEPKEVGRAAERMTISQEELLSKLQRTVRALERLMAEQMLRAALHKALELAAQQESLNQRTADDGAPPGDLSRAQAKVGDDAEQLARDLTETALHLSKLSPDAAETAGGQADKLEQDVVPASRDAADALADGDRSTSRKTGAQIQTTLSEIASSLQSALDSMRQSLGQQVAQDLRDAATALLDCSMLEEDVARRALGATRGSPLSQEQVELSEVVRSVADDLETLGQETFFVSPGITRPLAQSLSLMEQTAQHLSAGAAKQAQSRAQQAVGSLNTAVGAILDAAAQAQQSGSGSGLQQALDKLAALCQQQSGLNAQCEGMLSSQGEPMPSLGNLLAQLAAEQAALRAELRKVASAVEGRSHLAGPLGAAESDMEQVEKQLGEAGVTGETVATQQRILTRMLEARNSLYRQGYRTRRLSEEAKRYTSPPPPRAEEALLQPEPMDMRRAEFEMEEAPPEYREHVNSYFAAIRRGTPSKEDTLGTGR
jgi:hypothetical protein